jgi:radical SAM superfamily enzyme YgiQ (UPF0313 family)
MSFRTRRPVLLVQLPIPPLGPGLLRGNIPLAAGYLKLFAERSGLADGFDIQLFPAALANTLGDQALVAELARRTPWLIGFTCYLWNIERTLWIAHELKRRLPGVRIVLGGPEITTDNAWVLETPDYDFAVIGEGEQTFAQLLASLRDGEAVPAGPVPGLYVPSCTGPRYDPGRRPAFRTPMPDLNALGSPYRAGILDATAEQTLLLETVRGCVFRCKFCYYPRAYDRQYYLAPQAVLAELQHAGGCGVREVVLLDPTLNQRRDFPDFLRLLAEGNPGRRFRYFGELRGEGVTAETARLLREAHFTEVEVGLQSVEPEAMTRMDRKNNLRAFERGVRAMLAEGIRVKVDLIVGLPGDTVESVRRGLHYLRDGGLYSDVQVFNLAVLPGTAFRHDAAALGLTFQPRPPYYVLRTPSLGPADLYGLIEEAQELFGVEFDAAGPPVLESESAGEPQSVVRVDLDAGRAEGGLPTVPRAQAFTLWLRSSQFALRQDQAVAWLRRVLGEDPFMTLQLVLDASAADEAAAVCRSLPPALVEALLAACQQRPTYLDKFYALQPGRPLGAKRLLVLLPARLRTRLPAEWLEEIGARATLVWCGGADNPAETELAPHEFAWTR